MLGVTSSLIHNPSTFEFFELFKTPWEPFVEGHSYDVIICRREDQCRQHCRLLIIIHGPPSGPLVTRLNGGRRPSLLRWADLLFPVYTHTEEVRQGTPLIRHPDNRVAASTSHKDGQTTVRVGYDMFAEVRFLLESGQPVEYAAYPTLDIHIANLRAWLFSSGVPFIEIPPVPYGARFIACLTHDVDFAGIRFYKFDRTIAGFLYRASGKSLLQAFSGRLRFASLLQNWLAVAKLPLVYLNLLPDFWTTFQKYRELESAAPSTFFFVPFKNTPGRLLQGSAPVSRAVKYDLGALREELESLVAAGCEIGVHGIDSWVDQAQASKEFAKVTAVFNGTEIGIRMHWLYWGPDSATILEGAGYTYDSTSGYNESIGYRAGTSQVFRLPGAHRLLEVPMHIMDTALFYPDRMHLAPQEGAAAIRAFVALSAQNGGVLCLNWHDRSVAPERLWGDVYGAALHEMRESGATFLTAGATAAWFRARRAVSFEASASHLSPVSVWAPIFDPDNLRMFVRVYSPATRVLLEDKRVSSCAYRDVPLLAERTSLALCID